MIKNKISIIYISLLALGITITACSDENTKTDVPKENTITITAGQQQEAGTRIIYEDDGTDIITSWGGEEEQRIDAFNVYGAGPTLTFTLDHIKEETNGQIAYFTATGTDPGAGTYFALYPAVKASNSQSGLSLDVVGQIQHENANMNHLADKNYMSAGFNTTGLLEDASFTFKPLLSVIKFIVTTPSSASSSTPLSLTLSTPDNAGIIIGKEGNTLANPVYAKTQTILLNEVTPDADGTFTVYMAVFGGTMLAGQNVAVTVVYDDSSIYSYSVRGNSGNALQPGYSYTKRLTDGTLEAIPDESHYYSDTEPSPSLTLEDGYYLIRNAADFGKFIQDVNNGINSDAGYKLTTDIFLEYQDSWSPIGTNPHPFAGVFDGSGHSISGTSLFLTASSENDVWGFFGLIAGSPEKEARVENLNFSISNAGINAGDNEAITIAYGNIAGRLGAYSTINNCSYNGSISSAGGKSVIAIGGIVGIVDENATVSNCFRKGYLGNSGNATANNMIGGISGYNKGTITNCSNYSNINFFGSSNANIGGISGRNEGTISYVWSAGQMTPPAPMEFHQDVYIGSFAGVNEGTIIYSHNDNQEVSEVGYGNPPN